MAKRSPTLTRSQAAQRLGVSRQSVARYDGRELFPTRDKKGHRVYKAQEVDAFRIRRGHANKRERAAFIFDLFTECMELTEIVHLTRVHPNEVRELYDNWLTPLESGRIEAKRVQLSKRREKYRRERAEELDTILTEERQFAESLERLDAAGPRRVGLKKTVETVGGAD